MYEDHFIEGARDQFCYLLWLEAHFFYSGPVKGVSTGFSFKGGVGWGRGGRGGRIMKQITQKASMPEAPRQQLSNEGHQGCQVSCHVCLTCLSP